MFLHLAQGLADSATELAPNPAGSVWVLPFGLLGSNRQHQFKLPLPDYATLGNLAHAPLVLSNLPENLGPFSFQ